MNKKQLLENKFSIIKQNLDLMKQSKQINVSLSELQLKEKDKVKIHEKMTQIQEEINQKQKEIVQTEEILTRQIKNLSSLKNQLEQEQQILFQTQNEIHQTQEKFLTLENNKKEIEKKIHYLKEMIPVENNKYNNYLEETRKLEINRIHLTGAIDKLMEENQRQEKILIEKQKHYENIKQELSGNNVIINFYENKLIDRLKKKESEVESTLIKIYNSLCTFSIQYPEINEKFYYQIELLKNDYFYSMEFYHLLNDIAKKCVKESKEEKEYIKQLEDKNYLRLLELDNLKNQNKSLTDQSIQDNANLMVDYTNNINVLKQELENKSDKIATLHLENEDLRSQHDYIKQKLDYYQNIIDKINSLFKYLNQKNGNKEYYNKLLQNLKDAMGSGSLDLARVNENNDLYYNVLQFFKNNRMY